jgi:hypothetical protein
VPLFRVTLAHWATAQGYGDTSIGGSVPLGKGGEKGKIPIHALKTYRGSRSIAPLINLGTG